MVTNSFLVFDYHYSFMGFHGCVSVNIITLFGAHLVTALFIYPSSVDGHLGSFCFLVIRSNTAVNIHVQVSVHAYVFISFGYILKGGIAGLCRNCFCDPPNCFPNEVHHSMSPAAAREYSVHPRRHLLSLWPF